ncbi:MAG: hypothetical protein AAGF11_40090 [Myxococcota bacterium]
MPITIREGRFELEFADDWSVVLKWDDTPLYREGIGRLPGSKAVDILAYSRNRRRLLMLEVKDFRGHRIENRPRIRDGELFDEVGCKVRDTIAGVRGAVRTRDRTAIAELADKIATRVPLTVVLWLEEDRDARALPRSHRGRHRGRLNTMTQALKRRVRWLTPQALVCARGGVSLEAKGIDVRPCSGGSASLPGG